MTLGLALLNTYVPGMNGGPFLSELRRSAVLAVAVIALSAAIFVLLDKRDRRRQASKPD